MKEFKSRWNGNQECYRKEGGTKCKAITYSGVAAYPGDSFQFLIPFIPTLSKGFDQRIIHNSRCPPGFILNQNNIGTPITTCAIPKRPSVRLKPLKKIPHDGITILFALNQQNCRANARILCSIFSISATLPNIIGQELKKGSKECVHWPYIINFN